jgi:hypothetical protein
MVAGLTAQRKNIYHKIHQAVPLKFSKLLIHQLINLKFLGRPACRLFWLEYKPREEV